MEVHPVIQLVILPVDLIPDIFRSNNPSFTNECIKVFPDTRQGFLRIALVDLNKKRRIDNVKKNLMIGM